MWKKAKLSCYIFSESPAFRRHVGEHSMGLFCVNFHFQTTDDRALSQALNRRGISRYRVVPAKNGWTSLYEEQASEQDDRRIRDLAGGLSKDLHVPAIAFLVHDSDIACYWLFESGELLDEYNSNPGYFDSDADEPPKPSGGRPDLLVRYCRPGVRQEDLAAMLAQEAVRATTFAEDLIGRLAKALGIDRRLAIADHRDLAGDNGPGGMEGPDGYDDDDDGGPGDSPMQAGLMELLAKRFGFESGSAPADPQITALVQAAARGDTDEIDRLLAGGVAINGEGPAPLPGGQLMPGLAQLFPGGVPQILMTPLLAAVVHKQRPAAERLLRGRADPNLVHSRYGTPLHAATGAGDVELLQLLIAHRVDVNARNAQGQTPLQMLAATRTGLDQLVQMQATMKSMGMTLPPQMSNVSLPVEGWDACARLLKAHGGQ
jgi:hypothetical protein